MTRTERVADRAKKLKEELDAKQRQLAQVQAQQRELHRQALNKRRYHVGALADDAGLFSWSNAELAGLFQILTRLQGTTDPVKVLDGLLTDRDVLQVSGRDELPAQLGVSLRETR